MELAKFIRAGSGEKKNASSNFELIEILNAIKTPGIDFSRENGIKINWTAIIPTNSSNFYGYLSKPSFIGGVGTNFSSESNNDGIREKFDR